MHPERGPTRTAPPYSRFHCLVCKEFVLGTASGHCPRCGFVPPTAPQVPPLDRASRMPIVLVGIVLGLILLVISGTP